MTSPFVFLLLFALSLIFYATAASKDYGVDSTKDTCTFFGHDKVKICKYWYGIRSMWTIFTYSMSPEQTLNMTFTELKAHCDDYFVCLENSGCYKDFVNYQKLDKCIDDTFQVGPMWYCDRILRDMMDASPENLTDCVKEKLMEKNPEKVDCVSIQKTGECYLPDVEKHCDPGFAEMFKEHLELRLFNRACGGRQRYKDWDYKGGQDVALDFLPGGGMKVSDPKREGVVNGTDGDN